MGVEASLQGEVEALRESLRLHEREGEAREEREAERWERREETWKAKVAEAEAGLATAEVRERGLREQLDLSEGQLVEAGQLNMSVAGENSFSGELAELQQRQQLEAELGRARAEVEEDRAGARREGARAEALARELEEAQCEVVSYTRQVDRMKEEVQELEQELELERQGKVDKDGKGNSLFSEVEDRREKVEVQLRVFEDKYGLLKENYDSKLAQLQKTKMHNAQLLGLVGGRGGDSGHAAR